MADSYATTGSFQTVRVLSQNQVLDAEAIGIVTKPSGARFTVPVPLAAYQAGNADQYLAISSELVESLIAAAPDPGQQLVSGATGSQSIDGAGLIAYYINFTVAYTPTSGQQGTFSSIVTLPVSSFESAAAFDAPVNGVTPIVQITNAYDRLKQTASL